MADYLNVCRFRPTAGGTTDWTYSSAVVGSQSPALAGITNGATYRYRAESADNTQWEIGTGVYNTGTGVLTRATVLANSSGTGTSPGQSGAGSKINFSAIPQVAIVALKEDMPSLTAANSWTDTTEATGAGTTASALFAGGVEIAKKLFVAGAVALSTTLTVGTTAKIGTGADAAGTPAVALLVTNTADAAIAIRDSTADCELFAYAYSGGGIFGTLTNHAIAFRTNNTDRITLGTASMAVSSTIVSTTFASTSAATSTTTGAVRVSGGLGVAGAGYIGGALNVTDATASSSVSTGSGIFGGGVGITQNLFVGGTGNFAGVLSATQGGAASSTSTGALRVTGGAGITGAAYVGGLANIAGVLTVVDATQSTSPTSGSAIFGGGIGVAANCYVGGFLDVLDSAIVGPGGTGTNAIAVIIDGGSGTAGGAHLRFDKNSSAKWLAGTESSVLASGTSDNFIFRGNALTALSMAPTTGVVSIPTNVSSTSTTTGSLVVAGGLGVAGNIFGGALAQFGAGTDASSYGTANLYVNVAGTAIFAIRDSTNDIEFGFSTNTASGGVGVMAMRTSTHPLWIQIGGSNLFAFNSNGSLSVGNTTAAATANALNLSGIAYLCSATATPAGGSTSARLIFGTTSGFGIYYGSGLPTVSAAQGSIYLRSDGSSTSTRLYVNTNGTTGWTNFTSAT